MAIMTKFALLALIASPVASLVTQRKSTFGDVEMAVRQRLYAMMRSRVHDTKSSPLMMMRGRHGLHHDELKDAQINAEELSIVHGLSGEALGSAASLNEDGYKAVAMAESRAAMQAFVMRVLDREGLVMTNPNVLKGILPYYDGECASQNLENLVKELLDGTEQHGCHAPWTARKNGAALLEEHLETAEVRNHWNTVTSEGAFAPLNEDGYQAVAARHDNKEMATFIERVMRRDGLKVGNSDGLAGFVPYYSGQCATQTFEDLVADIHCVGPAAVTANVTYKFSATDAPTIEQLRQSIASAAGVDENVIVISDLVDATHASDPKTMAPVTKSDVPMTSALVKEPVEKTSKTIKLSISTEDSSVLSNIRKAMNNITNIQAHFDAFDADVDIEVKPDFDVVSVTPSACGGGWVTAA